MTRQTPAPADVLVLQNEVAERFGVLPSFFRLAPDVPEMGPALFSFAKFAYLDAPLPSLFKERLFVHLSRFCQVRYCLARHFCFLVGLGHPSGDASCEPMTPDQAITILKRSFMPHTQSERHLAFLRNTPGPLPETITPDSDIETALFAVSTALFMDPAKSRAYLPALRRLLGPPRYEYLLVFIGFVRMAHYWTQVHPELSEEEDLTDLIQRLEEIAWGLAWDPQGGWSMIALQVTDELKQLKQLSTVVSKNTTAASPAAV
jgi:hypothetical protein